MKMETYMILRAWRNSLIVFATFMTVVIAVDAFVKGM